jgi:glycosyltransferase involved in cell wall biosynthesis
MTNDILFFSSDDWDSGLKTSKFHVATRLARTHKVLFINSLGLRTPTCSAVDAKKALVKLKTFSRGIRPVRENLYVFSPIFLPFHGRPLAQIINRHLVVMQIRLAMAMLGIRAYDIWTFLPTTAPIVARLRPSTLIYYCVDNSRAFYDVPSQVALQWDRELVRKAAIVFCVSSEILRDKQKIGGNVCYCPHGVDHALFASALRDVDDLPSDASSFRRPVIGFWGLISRDWIDYGLVRDLAHAYPETTMLFIGRIDEDPLNLPSEPNLVFLNSRDYGDLYRYARVFDLAIIPFIKSPVTQYSNPLKALEYLAAGLPVVSTAIPELERLSDRISIASSKDEFIRLCGARLHEPQRQHAASLSRSVVSDDWDYRYQQILSAIERMKRGERVSTVLSKPLDHLTSTFDRAPITAP